MADAKDAKAGGGGAAPARRATDAQKAARARREKSIEVPVRDGDGEYVTIKANDPNVEVRWAPTALGMCSRWPGWKKAKTERAPKPTSLPGVPRDEFGFPSFLPDFAGQFGCHALVLEAAGDAGGAAMAADAKVVVEATFCASQGATGCGSTPVMCKQHCESALLWYRIHGVQRPACKQHKVDQAWEYADAEDDRIAAPVSAAQPLQVPPAALSGDVMAAMQQLQQQMQQQLRQQQEQFQLQLQQQQQLIQQQLLAFQQQLAGPRGSGAPAVPAAYLGGPTYGGAAASSPSGSELLDADAPVTRTRLWIDPLSGMAVDTQTAKLSVSRDTAVVAVYNEWARRKESKTIFEFLRSYTDHKEYTWRERPAVNGLPAVSVAEQKKEWKDLIEQLESVAKDHADVTKTNAGLRILRKLVIIHRSDSVDIVSALSESAVVDPRELTTYTRYQRGLPIGGGHSTTASVNANAGAAAGAGEGEGVVPGGVQTVVLKQQPAKH